MTDIGFSADMIKEVMNSYIIYYKSEIDDVDLFSGIDTDDIASTNIQLEMLYSEMRKYSQSDDKLKEVKMISEHDTELYDYIIYKNDIPYCTSELLFTALIENINLKNEDSDSNYKIRRKSNVEKEKGKK